MKVEKLYDFYSNKYNKHLSKNPLRFSEENILNKSFKKLIKKEDKVLEIGAGTGYYTIFLSTLCKQVIAVEPSKGMLAKLKKKTNDKILLRNTSFEKIKKEKDFDVLVAIGVAEHVDFEDMIQFFLRSNAKKAIFSFPTRTFTSIMMKIQYLLFGVKIRLYTPKKVAKYLENKGLKFNMKRCPLKYLKHHTIVLEVEKK